MTTYHYKDLTVDVAEASETEAIATLTKMGGPNGSKVVSVGTVTATIEDVGLMVHVEWSVSRFLSVSAHRALMNENAVYQYGARHDWHGSPYTLLCSYFADRSKAIVVRNERKKKRGDKRQ